MPLCGDVFVVLVTELEGGGPGDVRKSFRDFKFLDGSDPLSCYPLPDVDHVCVVSYCCIMQRAILCIPHAYMVAVFRRAGPGVGKTALKRKAIFRRFCKMMRS